MDGLISRQAVIDLWEKYHHTIAVDAMQYDAELRQLPPSQPEIIRCKDCKEYDPIYTGGAGVCGHWNAKTENNAYCSYAERRK